MVGSQDIRKDMRCGSEEKGGKEANRPGTSNPTMVKDCSKFA